MSWSNIWVIFGREVRDQLRDRRTLFMIFVLPILLYPMLGIGVLQLSAMLEQKPRKVKIIGAEALPPTHPLLNAERNGFRPEFFGSPGEAERLIVEHESADGPWGNAEKREEAIRGGLASAVIVVPKDLRKQLELDADIEIPIQYNSVDEPSQITYLRLKEVLARWKNSIVAARLKRDRKDEHYTEPIQVKANDVATAVEVGSSVWSRLFPFLLVMMALTGALYPAVDLCAGEKERGTMETLLISPASRSEIVLGKFFTVMLASVMTAILNLVSMGLTGVQLAHQVSGMAAMPGRKAAVSTIAPPTVQAALWMVLLLIPLAAVFSALCVALAVLAKSMKEGQYYMTPLYLVCLPLTCLILVPGIELSLFYSLVPITGVALLLRALILGSYDTAWRYFLPVLVPMLGYAALALRWAIDQFQREDVLFREAERYSLKSWVTHLFRDRGTLPTGGEAALCFSVIISISWFLMLFVAKQGEGAATSTASVVAGQAVILLPPLVMAVLLTSKPSRTLRLAWPAPRYFGLAVALVLSLNPIVNELRPYVEKLFPISSALKASIARLMSESPDLLTSLFVFAIIPAICEEFAFRGFILSGLESGHGKRTAILLSALMFGFLHVLLSLFQQLFNATLLGIVLALLAIRSGSILPGILFHAMNNGIAVSLSQWTSSPTSQLLVSWIFRKPAEGLYHVGWLGASIILSTWLVYQLWKRKPSEHEMTSEEAPMGLSPEVY